MKRLLSVVFCLFVLFSVTCAVQAEETTTQPQTTTVGDAEPTAEGNATTAPEGDTTTTTTKRIQTKMTLSYDTGTLQVRVKDGNGRPVRHASITVIADNMTYTVVTDEMGVAELTFSEAPAAVSGVMPAFQGEEFYYRQCSASVVLRGTTTEPTVTESTTVESTTTESVATTTTVTARPTASLTSLVLTTTDPDSANVVTETVTTTVTTVEEEETDNADVHVPRGLAIGMIILGAVLLLAAVALVVIFLIRTRRTDDQPEEDETAPDVSPVSLTGEQAEDADEPEMTEQQEPPAGEERVSLEDLFRDR